LRWIEAVGRSEQSPLWQEIVRRGLAPLTIGLVIAGGYVMARAGDLGWQGTLLTAAAVG
jgi:hypothetical protein